jgi:hypothetical protein
VVYESGSPYHYLLRLVGLELKYPDKLDQRRDDQAVEQRMAEIRAELGPLLNDLAWEVWAADEVRLDQLDCPNSVPLVELDASRQLRSGVVSECPDF